MVFRETHIREHSMDFFAFVVRESFKGLDEHVLPLLKQCSILGTLPAFCFEVPVEASEVFLEVS